MKMMHEHIKTKKIRTFMSPQLLQWWYVQNTNSDNINDEKAYLCDLSTEIPPC